MKFKYRLICDYGFKNLTSSQNVNLLTFRQLEDENCSSSSDRSGLLKLIRGLCRCPRVHELYHFSIVSLQDEILFIWVVIYSDIDALCPISAIQKFSLMDSAPNSIQMRRIFVVFGYRFAILLRGEMENRICMAKTKVCHTKWSSEAQARLRLQSVHALTSSSIFFFLPRLRRLFLFGFF